MLPESAPYWLTVLVAIIAWLFTSAIDQILKTPYLIYDAKDTEQQPPKSGLRTMIHMTNISEEKVYRKVIITVRSDEDDVITTSESYVTPYQPAWEGDNQPDKSDHSLVHTFPAIQPKNEFDIVIVHSKNKALHISARSDDSSILFTQRDYLRTFVFANYFYIILWALVAAVVAISAAVVAISIAVIKQLWQEQPEYVKKVSKEGG
jgi:hypothetical protein